MKSLPARSSVVDEIVAFNRDRDSKLVRLKFRRMAKDPFAFFRGTAHLFAADWPRLSPPDVGPSILICGDLHLENFGAYRADDGDFLYDINDFDEALVAPCSLDLVRCAASVLLAAQLWKHTPVQAMRSLLAFLDRYRATVIRSARTGRIRALTVGTARGPVWGLLQRPVRATQVRFLDQFTERQVDGTRRIERRTGRFLAVGRKQRERIREAVERRGFEVLDVAFRIAGTGSLGLERYAVLARGEGQSDPVRILDIKEQRCPALLVCADEGRRNDDVSDARRAVEAQRRLQAKPTACLDVLDVDGREYRMRELIPEENRTGLDRLRRYPKRLRRAVAIAGRLAGSAHVRGCRPEGDDRRGDLARWAAGPGLDAVIASAVRYAERTRQDHKTFSRSSERFFR
jgi:uncharacterized protein (DUF2252 family)